MAKVRLRSVENAGVEAVDVELGRADFQTDGPALSVGAAACPYHQPGKSPGMAGPVEQPT